MSKKSIITILLCILSLSIIALVSYGYRSLLDSLNPTEGFGLGLITAFIAHLWMEKYGYTGVEEGTKPVVFFILLVVIFALIAG